jgi:hypothetical protein
MFNAQLSMAFHGASTLNLKDVYLSETTSRSTSQRIVLFTVTSVKTWNPTASIASYAKFGNEALPVSPL